MWENGLRDRERYSLGCSFDRDFRRATTTTTTTFEKCPRTRQSVFERDAKFDPDTITFRRSRSSSSDGGSDCSNDRSKVEPLESTCDMWWIKSRENNSSSSSSSSINSNNNLSKLNWKCMWKKNKEKK